ncbi:MAG: universal stress protein [Lentisphaeria bacterium]|nr:universal stress protein [Lentisphaeria bacterium]
MSTYIVAVDFSDVCGLVVNQAAKLAAKSGAELVLVHIEPPSSGFIYFVEDSPFVRGYGSHVLTAEDKVSTAIIKNDSHALEILKQQVEALKVPCQSILMQGNVVEEVVAQAKVFKAELLFLGNHRAGVFQQFVLGSTENSIIEKSPCPVVLVPKDILT